MKLPYFASLLLSVSFSSFNTVSANPTTTTALQKRNGGLQLTCPYHWLQFTPEEERLLWGARGDSVDVLVGVCNISGTTGAWRISKLKLKRCIENRDGKMVYVVSKDDDFSRKGSTFPKTCKECKIVGMAGELQCNCQKDAVDPAGIHMSVFSSIMLMILCGMMREIYLVPSVVKLVIDRARFGAYHFESYKVEKLDKLGEHHTVIVS